ncbi:DUF7115 domain-containing protein [Halogeometricum limi]|uniref:DUF7115 domain-containing protein n=1 Tax=Halogeometricum limi TaxID=555875 RepID=A0A1I6HML0_9EURY|nr:hypothetical protein [Halogeometricum limi]SFR55685.1 hypothetical protein SAMN04488124_2403 [Halogeometricum limi]
MSQPQMVQSALEGEDVVARVALGGEDELYATPTRTLVYRSEGILSDEAVEAYPHTAERITVSEGRRKAKITLDYGLDGEETFGLPVKQLDRALHPVVEGVLKANDILADDEPMQRLFRFSELTLVVSSRRVVKHIGASLWDEDFEEYRYDDVADLQFESGSVATSVVMTVAGRQERFKAPNEEARALRETLESALLDYWGVSSVDELRAANEPDEEEPAADAEDVSFGDGPDPLSANPSELSEEPANATRSPSEAPAETSADASAAGQSVARQVEAPAESTTESVETEAVTDDGDAGNGDGFDGSGFESAAADANERVADELAELRATVDRQGEEIREQRELIEQLIDELRRGR